MGNCYQCYPIFSPNKINNDLSPLNDPQIIMDLEAIKKSNSNNTHIIKANIENNSQKKQNTNTNNDKTLNHGTTLTKHELTDENLNINELIPLKENCKTKNSKNLLGLGNNNKINKRGGTLNSDSESQSNKKYNKLQSFTRQLSTESFLRAKTKGDKIIDQIPKHLGPRQISWDEGGFRRFLENKNAYTKNGNSNSLRSNIYLRKISELSKPKKSNRLSIIKEDEIEEDRRNSTTQLENMEHNRNNKLINKIKTVNLFKNNLDSIQLDKLSLIINEYEIQPDMDIFCKGEIGSSFFILDEGEIIIYDDDPQKNITIKDEYNFGEICLGSNEDIRRTYNIITITKTRLFILDIDKFNEFLEKQNINIKTLDITYLLNIDFFQDFHEEELNLLSKFCFILKEKDLKKNKNGYIFITLKEFFNLEIKTCLQKYYIKIELPKNEENDEENQNTIQYLIIPINILFEYFGFDLKKKVVQNTFIRLVQNEENFLKNFNTNIPQINSVFYSLFKIKCLNKDTSLRIKLANKDFMFLLIDGSVKFYNNDELVEEYNSIIFIDTKKIKNKTKMHFKINSIILYSNYNGIYEKSEELKNFYNNKLSIFRNFSFLNLLEEDELFQLVSLIHEKTYEKDYILMNEQKCENFYLIINGKVKHQFQNNETIMHYCEGECFGETFLLDGEGSFLKDSYIIVTSDKLTTLEIPKDIFFRMLELPKINDYIKIKMCLEDKSISLSDLYYITVLGKGKFGDVYLVHNGIFIYAIKVVSRSFIKNKTKAWNYLQNENNILKYLHYQFIIKLVKTFKTKYLVYFLMEYSTGSQLDKVLKIISNKMNINIVKFYGSLLFLILDYLAKQKIIHRDIKPSNIMVDSSGYIKLVDFGAAKRILNGYAKTMIGTPFFMAPEIISGEHYSFPADYFSVGVCLYYIYYKKYPFGMGKPDVYLIYEDILKKPVSFIELNNQNNSLNELIKCLLDKEPSVRISNLKSIKNHSFFKNFDWDAIVTKKSDPPYLPTNGKNYTEQYLDNTSRHFEQFIEERKNELIKNDENYKDDDIKSERSKTSNESSWMDELF